MDERGEGKHEKRIGGITKKLNEAGEELDRVARTARLPVGTGFVESDSLLCVAGPLFNIPPSPPLLQ